MEHSHRARHGAGGSRPACRRAGYDLGRDRRGPWARWNGDDGQARHAVLVWDPRQRSDVGHFRRRPAHHCRCRGCAHPGLARGPSGSRPRAARSMTTAKTAGQVPLGTFEEHVMLAVIRLRAEAYGMTVRREIESQTGRDIAIGAVYSTLDRLEAKGLVASSRGPVGGISRRLFAITPPGVS